jgi:HEAT repeat protein
LGDQVTEQIAALRDEDWAIREEAAIRLGHLGDSRAVSPLVSILKDRDRSVREAAIAALTAIGPSSVEALGGCLTDPDLSVQEAASAVLATIADDRVLDPLLRALASHDWIVRMHAAKALGRLANPLSVPRLIPLLHDKVKAVREEAAAALAAIGEASVPALLEAMRHQEWLMRLHAVEALGKTRSSSAVEPLLGVVFNDPDSAVREDAVRALGDIGDTGAVEFLFAAMKDPGLRTLAVEALGKIGDRRAVPVLIDVVTGSDRPDVTRPVAGCGDQWSEEIVTQGAAIRALGSIRDESALPALVAALSSTVTRAEAAAALAQYGSKVIPLLLPFLAGPSDENLRYHINETLTLVGWRPGRL